MHGVLGANFTDTTPFRSTVGLWRHTTPWPALLERGQNELLDRLVSPVPSEIAHILKKFEDLRFVSAAITPESKPGCQKKSDN